MRQTPFAMLVSSILLTAFAALAQTTAPSPATDAAPAGGGVADWWWVILIVVVVAAAIWYFMGRGRRTQI